MLGPDREILALGHENGSRPTASGKYLPIRTSRPVNNIYILCNSYCDKAYKEKKRTNFNRINGQRELRLEDGSLCSMYSTYQSSSSAAHLCSVIVGSTETLILPRSAETAILCELDSQSPLTCREVLIEPINQRTELVGACRMITQSKMTRQVILRVANFDTQDQKLYEGLKLAWANPNFEVGLRDRAAKPEEEN